MYRRNEPPTQRNYFVEIGRYNRENILNSAEAIEIVSREVVAVLSLKMKKSFSHILIEVDILIFVQDLRVREIRLSERLKIDPFSNGKRVPQKMDRLRLKDDFTKFTCIYNNSTLDP